MKFCAELNFQNVEQTLYRLRKIVEFHLIQDKMCAIRISLLLLDTQLVN